MKTKSAVVLLSFLLYSHYAFADAKPANPDAKLVKDAGAPDIQPVKVDLPKEAPKDAKEAVKMGQEAISMTKAGNWFGFSSLAIWILMFLLKVFGLFQKIGKRWAYIIVPVLSVAAMLLAKFAGDLSWTAALAVLTSGPVAALANDFVKRGVLGKEPKTPVKS